jgi:L-tyrosine peroxygenase
MNHATMMIVKELPPPGRWDFGGFPYGLEPLTLPTPDTADDTWDPGSSYVEDVCRRLLTTELRSGTTEGLDTFTPENELFWFRWITGHQVSFIIWQLMARVIRKVTRGEGPREDLLEEISHYARGYCGMLLYTSSCSRVVYETVIRPSMYLQHRGFSGSWAPDFRPVRDLFRGRRLPWTDTPEAAGLLRAIRLYQLIHNGVAAKLVPNGRSLLQRSGPDTHTQDRRLLDVIYDNYFMTLRAPVPLPDVVAQLLRRLNAVALDVAVNGLHPMTATNGAEASEELCLDEVVDFERDFTRVNFCVASFAAGFTSRYVREQLASADDLAPVVDLT